MNSPDSIATSSPSLEKVLLLSLLVVDSSREARPAAHFPLLLLLSHRHLFLTQPPPTPQKLKRRGQSLIITLTSRGTTTIVLSYISPHSAQNEQQRGGWVVSVTRQNRPQGEVKTG